MSTGLSPIAVDNRSAAVARRREESFGRPGWPEPLRNWRHSDESACLGDELGSRSHSEFVRNVKAIAINRERSRAERFDALLVLAVRARIASLKANCTYSGGLRKFARAGVPCALTSGEINGHPSTEKSGATACPEGQRSPRKKGREA